VTKTAMHKTMCPNNKNKVGSAPLRPSTVVNDNISEPDDKENDDASANTGKRQKTMFDFPTQVDGRLLEGLKGLAERRHQQAARRIRHRK
jgi:hypothetical protein